MSAGNQPLTATPTRSGSATARALLHDVECDRVTHTSPPVSASQALTAREREILEYLALGRSTDSISTELYLSLHTVRNHVRNILSKLGAHSKLEAVAIAAREGVIKLGSHSGD